MARKKLGDVELQWTCPNCNGLNPGSARFCLSCGAAQPEDVEFHLPERQELLSDGDKIAQAQAGPDIHCPYCGTRNPAGSIKCVQCGGDLSEGAIRASGKVLGAFQEQPAGTVTCPNCGSENPDTALKCANCGASLAKETQPRPVPAQAASTTKGRNPLLVIGIVAVVVVLCLAAAAVYLIGSRTSGLSATVEQTHWERSIPIEALVPVEHQGWFDNIPSDAEVGQCQEQVREVVDQPVPNSVEVCGTPYTVDSGSGFGEVVQDCSYEVYDNYCAYTLTEWQQVDLATASGSDFSPIWPEPQLQPGERLGNNQTETYIVVFHAEDGSSYNYHASDFQTYQQYPPGSEWTLVVNGFGDIVDVQP
jgi:DNA-directed RNA polymerase subunit RPC12/RpoP